MGVTHRAGALFFAASLSAAAGAECRADELLVMPFTCAVVGGQPTLTPSRDEGYRVLTRREQRTVTTCSPINPDMCRQWTVHRFDLDCGGVRVPGLGGHCCGRVEEWPRMARRRTRPLSHGAVVEFASRRSLRTLAFLR
jgi:hypothetical protein